METITLFGVLCTFIGLCYQIWTQNSKINNKLNQIIKGSSGTLTKEQAHDLVSLYLSSIQLNLQKKMVIYLNGDYVIHKKQMDEAGIRNFIYSNATKTIAGTRDLLKTFTLSGGVNFRDFLNKQNPLDDGIIGKAKDEVCAAFFADMRVTSSNSELLASELVSLVRTAGEDSQRHLIAKIDKAYR